MPLWLVLTNCLWQKWHCAAPEDGLWEALLDFNRVNHVLSVLITNNDDNNNGRGKLWEVTYTFMLLMVVMVSQVLPIPKLTEWYTLNTYSFLYVNHTSIQWLKTGRSPLETLIQPCKEAGPANWRMNIHRQRTGVPQPPTGPTCQCEREAGLEQPILHLGAAREEWVSPGEISRSTTQPTWESWEIPHHCFQPLSFGVVYNLAKGNWFRTGKPERGSWFHLLRCVVPGWVGSTLWESSSALQDNRNYLKRLWGFNART